MSSWLKDGRPAILEALAAACDVVDERARAEIEARTRKHEQLIEELESLRTRVAQVDRLQQENESLQAEIHRLQEIQDAQAVKPNNRVALGELSANNSTTEKRISTRKSVHETATGASDPVQYKAVVDRCRELDAKYKGARSLLDECRIKLRKRTETIHAWARYSDTLQRALEQTRARLRSRPASANRAPTAQADEAGVVTTVEDGFVDIAEFNTSGMDSTFEHEPPSSPPRLIDVPGGNSALPPPRQIVSELSPRLPLDEKSRTTDTCTATETLLAATDDVDLPPYIDQPVEALPNAIKVEPSSDPPVIVSTRSVRKRKYCREDTEIVRSQKIKLELSDSSGPESTCDADYYSPAKSIDFDEEVHVPTPKKRRILPEPGHADSVAVPDGISRPSPLLHGRAMKETSSRPDKPHDLSRRIVDSKPPKSHVLLDALPQPKGTGQVSTKEMSVNSDGYASLLALGVKDLAEDGDAEKADVGSNQFQRPGGKGRLNALLNSPSMKPRPQISRHEPHRFPTPRPVSADAGSTGSRFPTASNYMRDANTAHRDTQHLASKQRARNPLSPKPRVSQYRALKNTSKLCDDLPRGRTSNREDVPLRERPIERLRPEDFKPNPLYNDGLKFVYDEVVRGKDARAALSGCIDPNCCGKTFRRFAETELKSVGSSVTTRVEEVSLMERYLGVEAFKLGIMTREEREGVWLKAKTWELANKFGKHRQRYSRMPSPPGFWSMDFPNTQERAEELRQAEDIRKALVNERHREAMRCNGSWLFRDEEPR